MPGSPFGKGGNSRGRLPRLFHRKEGPPMVKIFGRKARNMQLPFNLDTGTVVDMIPVPGAAPAEIITLAIIAHWIVEDDGRYAAWTAAQEARGYPTEFLPGRHVLHMAADATVRALMTA